MRRRNDGAGGSLREEFGDVCFHALGIIDQNREYLQMHLLASADLPTRQALSDIQIESARPGGGTRAQVVFPLASCEDIPPEMELHSSEENDIRAARFASRAAQELLLLRRY